MSDLIKLFSSDNFTMSSSWIEVLYCSFEDDGTILIIEHKTGDGAEEWYETAVDVSKPADFIEAINRLENIAFDCINTVISSLEDNNHQFASVLKEELLLQEKISLGEPLQTKPSMASDASESSETSVFFVGKRGTLSLEGYRGPETRMDAYGISSSYFMTYSDLGLEANTHQPVLWELQNLFTNWRDAEIETLSSNSSNQDSAEVFQTKWDEDFLDDADNVTNWLKQLSKEQFSQVSKAMLAWGSGDPSCDDDDFIDEPMSGQDMAYQMFSEGCYADEAEVLGIEIVEGDHPGSSYYAAELSIPLAEANKKAEAAGFDLRFRAEDKNAHGLEQEQHNELMSATTDGASKVAAQNLKKLMEDRASKSKSMTDEELKVAAQNLKNFVEDQKLFPNGFWKIMQEAKKRYPDANQEELLDLATVSSKFTGHRLWDAIEEARRMEPDADEETLVNMAEEMSFYGWG